MNKHNFFFKCQVCKWAYRDIVFRNCIKMPKAFRMWEQKEWFQCPKTEICLWRWVSFLNRSIIDTWRRQWQPTPVLLPGKSHGQRSLVGCSPWGRGELDMIERLHFHFSLSHIGEGKGNPLQCSCLENPKDGGAWWGAVYGVAQHQTQLKRLSSS